MVTFRKEASSIYLWAVLFVLPILFHNMYEDLVKWKAHYFWVVSAVFLLCGIIAGTGRILERRAMGALPPAKELAASLSPLDRGILAFFLVTLLSSLTSRHTMWVILFGELSQYVAAATLLAVLASYFILSRSADRESSGYVLAFFLSSAFVLTVGLANSMHFDVLGMHQYDTVDTLLIMASTIGNVDYYCAYVAIVLIFFAAYRMDMERGWKALAVDVLLVACYMVLWTARASGIWGGTLFGLCALPVFSLTSSTRLKGLFWQGFLSGIAGFLCAFLSRHAPTLYYGLETEVSGIFQLRHFWLPFGGICLAVWLLLCRAEKAGRPVDPLPLLRRMGLPIAACLACIMLLAGGLILFYPPVQEATGRAFIWNDIKAAFPLETVREKLIGVGPGCLDLSLILFGFYGYGDVYHLTAHNEMFEFWYLTGFLGAASYFAIAAAFFGSFFYRAIRQNQESHFREMCCCGAAFAAYLGTGLTNGPYIPNIVVAGTFLALFRRYQIPDAEF